MTLRGQEQIDFGDGHFVGPLYGDPEFLFHFDYPGDEDYAGQARFVGHANGCPVVQELIEERGAEAMLNRYGEVNFWFTEITRMAEESNYPLYQQLTAYVPRLYSEPVGKHEPGSVPDMHEYEIVPLGTLTGWALPRLFITQLGGHDQSVEEAQGRMDRGLAVLDSAIEHARTPAELLALAAEGFSQADLTRQDVLTQVLAEGWLEEQGAVSMVEDVKLALSLLAPEVWDAYYQMSSRDIARLHLV